MFADVLIPRLRSKGLTVHDVRSQLPRNGTFMTRPLAHITGISGHWDAENRPLNYDSLARYIRQANYHINKDWGGGYGGDGLMYHFKIDNIGDLYITRNAEEVTWQVGNANYNYLGYCLDGLYQDPTREQAHTVEMLLDVLTLESPEIAAGQQQVKGHKEIPGNSTACPGNGLALITNYRASGYVGEDKYVYEIDPAPAPPAPAPASTFDWSVVQPIDIGFTLKNSVRMYNVVTGEALWDSGNFIHATGKTPVIGGSTYYIPVDRMAAKEPFGFREQDLDWSNIKEPQTAPVEPPAPPVPVVDPLIQAKAEKYDQLVKEVKDLTTIIGD